jgi:hypothetical protein
MGDNGYKPLRLRAEDLGDLTVIAAALQDALVPAGDMAWLRDEGSFVMAVNRFRWEASGGGGGAESKAGGGARHERVHAGLRFDNVKNVQYRGIDHGDRGNFLELLTIACDDGRVVLHFAGGAAIRLEVEALVCALADLDEPWPTAWKPAHGDAGEEDGA